MGVIKKKMKAGNGLPASYNNLSREFTNLHVGIITYLEKTLRLEIAQEAVGHGPTLMGYADFDTLKKDMTGLFFAIGEAPKKVGSAMPSQILLEISKDLASTALAEKLGSQNDKKPVLTLFDLLVMQPLVAVFTNGLDGLMGASSRKEITDRSIAVDDFIHAKFSAQEKWLKLYFHIPIKENKKINKDADKQKQTGKYSADLSLTLYIAQPIAENIMSTAKENKSHIIIDPDDPWTQHMRDILLSSTRSLEIVIEHLRFSVAECTRLQLGQTIALPGASHERLNIKTRTRHGSIVLAGATLGVFKSRKAVKLSEDIDPEFLKNIASV